MGTGRTRWAALCLTLVVSGHPAVAATHAPATIASCLSSVAFGPAEWQARTLVFRATLNVACPLEVAFSIALRSSSGCEMRTGSGGTLRYELFSDAALRTPIVSCERSTVALTGTGRQVFIIYGRVDGPVFATGQFHDALVSEISP